MVGFAARVVIAGAVLLMTWAGAWAAGPQSARARITRALQDAAPLCVNVDSMRMARVCGDLDAIRSLMPAVGAAHEWARRQRKDADQARIRQLEAEVVGMSRAMAVENSGGGARGMSCIENPPVISCQ